MNIMQSYIGIHIDYEDFQGLFDALRDDLIPYLEDEYSKYTLARIQIVEAADSSKIIAIMATLHRQGAFISPEDWVDDEENLPLLKLLFLNQKKIEFKPSVANQSFANKLIHKDNPGWMYWVSGPIDKWVYNPYCKQYWG